MLKSYLSITNYKKDSKVKKASGLTQEVKTLESTSKNIIGMKMGMLLMNTLYNFKTNPARTHSVLHNWIIPVTSGEQTVYTTLKNTAKYWQVFT